MDNGVAHICALGMWIVPRVIHEVIHKRGIDESRYTALRADMRAVFHVSTAIHRKMRDVAGLVMNTRPQCVQGGDECGYPR